MSRRAAQRLDDIIAAADAIAAHLQRGHLDDVLVFDAVRVRLIEIGEAVKGIDPELLDREPGVPWVDVAGMRNHLAHRYFDTAHAIVRATLDHDLPPLVDAARRLRADLDRAFVSERIWGATGRISSAPTAGPSFRVTLVSRPLPNCRSPLLAYRMSRAGPAPGTCLRAGAGCARSSTGGSIGNH